MLPFDEFIIFYKILFFNFVKYLHIQKTLNAFFF
jgi:hypothetical protein